MQDRFPQPDLAFLEQILIFRFPPSLPHHHQTDQPLIFPQQAFHAFPAACLRASVSRCPA
jgi:hypothetical protein